MRTGQGLGKMGFILESIDSIRRFRLTAWRDLLISIHLGESMTWTCHFWLIEGWEGQCSRKCLPGFRSQHCRLLVLWPVSLWTSYLMFLGLGFHLKNGDHNGMCPMVLSLKETFAFKTFRVSLTFFLPNPMPDSKAHPVSHTFKICTEYSCFSPHIPYPKTTSSLALVIAA